MNENIVANVWKKQNLWSATAGDIRASIAMWRTVTFGLAIAGAFLATLSTQVPDGSVQKLCAWMGAVCLAIIPVVSQRKLKPEQTRAWVRARSVAEAIKAEVYLYLAGARPYDDGSGAVALLRDRAEGIEDDVDDLSRYTASVTPHESQPPGPLSPEDYLERRVWQQINGYYRPKAQFCQKQADTLRAWEFMLAIAAAALAAATGVWGETVEVMGGGNVAIGAWVAVLTTIGGTITAHISASRYDFLVTNYLATAQRLEKLASRWPPTGGAQPSPDEWSDFAQQCEAAISSQNEGWMAKLTTSGKP